MEKRAMAVREEQWIQTIAAAKQSGQPIKVSLVCRTWRSFVQLLQVAAKNERCPADCAKFRNSISGAGNALQ